MSTSVMNITAQPAERRTFHFALESSKSAHVRKLVVSDRKQTAIFTLTNTFSCYSVKGLSGFQGLEDTLKNKL